MDVEVSRETKTRGERAGKGSKVPGNSRDPLQQKTTAESGEYDEGWLTAFLAQKGTDSLLIA